MHTSLLAIYATILATVITVVPSSLAYINSDTKVHNLANDFTHSAQEHYKRNSSLYVNSDGNAQVFPQNLFNNVKQKAQAFYENQDDNEEDQDKSYRGYDLGSPKYDDHDEEECAWDHGDDNGHSHHHDRHHHNSDNNDNRNNENGNKDNGNNEMETMRMETMKWKQ
ncbi:unnamed protein product [Mucor hiemalis]